MKICALSASLADTFKRMGHEVLAIAPAAENTLLDLPSVLAEQKFVPELVFQEESLGSRIILQGLEHIDCPKIFWSLDTHLNLFWQSYYFRLFNGIMTPHAQLLRQSGLQGPPVARLARFGYELPWRPHAQRPNKLAFVGRLSEYRPLRSSLVHFLKDQYQATIFSDVPFPQLLEIYLQSSLAPNEAIAAEVNFRLMETASCGCLVINQNAGRDQDALFTPGLEILTYEDITELKDLIDFFIKHPELAERKARAAWERVRSEHLAQHRAQAVLDFASTLHNSGAVGDDARAALWLTIWSMRKGGRNSISLPKVTRALEQLPASTEVSAALLNSKTASGDKEGFVSLAAKLLAENRHAADLECNLAGSLGALLFDMWNLAKQFWYRHCRVYRKHTRRLPKNTADLCLLWSVELQQAGVLHHPGLSYQPGEHTPCSALECLALAQSLDPENLQIVRRIEEIYSHIDGGDYFRLGCLSKLSLYDKENWRMSLSLGILNLRTFRLQQGLQELALAHTLACRQNREKAFFRTLARLDQRGYINNALARYLQNSKNPGPLAQTTNQAV